MVGNLLYTSDNDGYDLVTIYMMDHGGKSGFIEVQGGSIRTADVVDWVVNSNPNTRIHIIMDCCYAGALDPDISSKVGNASASGKLVKCAL